MARKTRKGKVAARTSATGKRDAKAKRVSGAAAAADAELSNKDYERELKKLHVELVKLQEWIKEKGLKVCILFEGRDGAGKGGTIKALTERVSPRVFRVIALPAPTEREKSQMYAQRYITHLPAAGEIVIFDRSWYNRAGVERVMGFCTDEEAKGFLKVVPLFETLMIQSGIVLPKYWLEESGPEEETRRLQDRIEDGRKGIWKLSPMDLKSVRPLGRLHACARRDVRRDRHRMGSVGVCGSFGRQEARAAERHQPSAEAGARQGREARQGQAAEAQGRSLQGGRPSVQVRRGTVLSPRQGDRHTAPLVQSPPTTPR